MRVAEVMTKDVKTCRPEASLAEAAKVMWEGDFGAVPLADTAGRLRGMLTDRDACMAAFTKGRPLPEIRAWEVATGTVESCRADSDVDEVAGTMARKQVRRLPVVDKDQRVVGILSLNDLALDAADDQARMLRVAKTLGAISRHRPRATAR